MVVVSYSMVVLTAVYTFQFQVVAGFFKETLKNGKNLDPEAGGWSLLQFDLLKGPSSARIHGFWDQQWGCGIRWKAAPRFPGWELAEEIEQSVPKGAIRKAPWEPEQVRRLRPWADVQGERFSSWFCALWSSLQSSSRSGEMPLPAPRFQVRAPSPGRGDPSRLCC